MFRKLFLIAAAAVGGIYLTSEEGKQARAALMKKKSTFEPVVKDLLKQVNDVLEGSKQINSDEIRANVNMLVKEAKQTIVEIDLEKAVETIREAIKVASRKIREAENEIEVEKTIEKTKVFKAPNPVKPEVVFKAPKLEKKTKAKAVSTKKPVAKKAGK